MKVAGIWIVIAIGVSSCSTVRIENQVSADGAEGAETAGPAIEAKPTKESAELHGESGDRDTTESDDGGRVTGDDSVIEVAEVPTVSAAPVARVLSEESGADQQVCRREMQTGSHRAVRICRTRAEIAALELEGKDTFKDLHRSQKEYNQR